MRSYDGIIRDSQKCANMFWNSTRLDGVSWPAGSCERRQRFAASVSRDVRCGPGGRGFHPREWDRRSVRVSAWSLSTLRALSPALADAISSFSSVILSSAVSPPFRMQDLPTMYGVKVFIHFYHTRATHSRFTCGVLPGLQPVEGFVSATVSP
jgi:hypothetical protein